MRSYKQYKDCLTSRSLRPLNTEQIRRRRVFFQTIDSTDTDKNRTV